ncbi:MAG: glutathione S-transferase family protein [Burkholderiales bacterium]|nr:glutathione S-transferase family protein [Burkholderiales bacterium]
MSDIILHHYPQSPVSEKVRIGLGIKKLAWRSVEIPRIPPKPELMPLTGGYRRTPVMQIGADIFCDSQCILRELQRRFPEPSFFPGGGDGMPWAVNRWADYVFDQVVGVVMGAAADQLPEAFARDRGRLYFGPNFDFAQIKAQIPHNVSQLRAQFGWLDQRFAAGRKFMLGEHPGLPDAVTYYLVWFIRGRWESGKDFLAEFPALEAWEQRVAALGHGKPTDMAASDALQTAKSSQPNTPEHADSREPLGLKPGMTVSVVADVDGGEDPVTGPVRYIDRDSIAVMHNNEQVGSVCIHFPRVGYRVTVV